MRHSPITGGKVVADKDSRQGQCTQEDTQALAMMHNSIGVCLRTAAATFLKTTRASVQAAPPQGIVTIIAHLPRQHPHALQQPQATTPWSSTTRQYNTPHEATPPR
jgi:hypothetical protein